MFENLHQFYKANEKMRLIISEIEDLLVYTFEQLVDYRNELKELQKETLFPNSSSEDCQ